MTVKIKEKVFDALWYSPFQRDSFFAYDKISHEGFTIQQLVEITLVKDDARKLLLSAQKKEEK